MIVFNVSDLHVGVVERPSAATIEGLYYKKSNSVIFYG